jgi:hypothetical protein
VLFAIGAPAVFLGLVLSFLLGLVLRAVTIRVAARRLGLTERRDSLAPRLREDIDPFGGVAAAIGGMGWGKALSVDEVPRYRGRGRAVALFAAGPVVCILVAQLLFLAYVLLFPDNLLSILLPAEILRGATWLGQSIADQILLGLATGLLCFGLLALIPMPPLDGFGILYHAQRNPGGRGMQGYRLWFEDKNIGVLVLLVCSLFPFGYPLLMIVLNILGLLFIRLWG